MTTDQSVRDGETHVVIGAALEVRKELGCGFLEQVYQDALVMRTAGPRHRVRPGSRTAAAFQGPGAALVLPRGLLVLRPAADRSQGVGQAECIEEAQMINDLKAARAERGLVFNFGARSLEWKRLVFSEALHPRSDRATVDR